ncbi:MAG: hypothetical protein WCO12_02130 [bacterium]
MKKALMAKNESVDLNTTNQSKKVREFFNTKVHRYDVEGLCKKYGDTMDATGGRRVRGKDAINLLELSNSVQYALGLETHVPVAESVDVKYRHLITEMIRKIEKEYDCGTAIEKTLAETIALSHVRIICFSSAMDNYVPGKISINKEINDYYAIASKELDRAHRQLTNAIMTLRQIKMPYTPLNITAKTAFIAQNQQFNDHVK